IEELKQDWAPFQDRLQFIQGDVTRKEDLSNLIEKAMSKFGRIDYLICNAGPYVFERKKLIDYEESEWNEIIDGNLNSVFYLLKETIPIMRKQKFGRVITYGFQDAETSPGWMYRSAFS